MRCHTAHGTPRLVMRQGSNGKRRSATKSLARLCIAKATCAMLPSCKCEGVRVVIGDEAPIGGVAQVILHGVRVVEVSLQVREHEEGEKEKDGEVQVEVKGEVEENQGRQHMCDMRMT